MSLIRRLPHSLAGLIVLSLVAAACGAPSETNSTDTSTPSGPTSIEDTTTTTEAPDSMVVAARGSIDASPLWVADSEGFFAVENLDINFAPSADENALFQALVDGEADVAVVSTSSAVRRAMFDGDQLEFITYLDGTQGGRDERRGTMSLVAATRSVARGCDLEGKRVGVDSEYSLGAVALREMMKRGGCDPLALDLVIGDSITHLQELQAGTLDAVAMLDPYTSRASRDGFEIVANLDDELCPDYGRCPISMVVAARDWAEANPEIVKRFQASIDEAMFWIRQNELAYRAELVSCCALTPDDASEIVVPDFVGERRQLKGDLPRLLEILVSQGQATSRGMDNELSR